MRKPQRIATNGGEIYYYEPHTSYLHNLNGPSYTDGKYVYWDIGSPAPCLLLAWDGDTFTLPHEKDSILTVEQAEIYLAKHGVKLGDYVSFREEARALPAWQEYRGET